MSIRNGGLSVFEQLNYYLDDFGEYLLSGALGVKGFAVLLFIVFICCFSGLWILDLIHSYRYRKLFLKYSQEKQRAKDFEEAYDAVSKGYLELCNKYREKEEENDSSV